MIKGKDYGFKTPIRRETSNISGHKVGGQYTGANCRIVRGKSIKIEKTTKLQFDLNSDDSPLLFTQEVSVFAVGGYFISDAETSLTIEIEIEGITTSRKFILTPGVYKKVGLESSFDVDEISPASPIDLTLLFETDEECNVQYTQFAFDFVRYPYLQNNDVYSVFYNSKKDICFPEQFYFQEEIVLPDSIDGDPIIIKSCNRCQRFLPINHLNERNQLAFSNHCSTKAPCKHATFSKYEIETKVLSDEELKEFIDKGEFSLDGNLIISRLGHQLECKACKKFFVNSALNGLRSSTQHREDGLRRRAFERLIGLLSKTKWIYHSFREKTDMEFDRHIWEKFDKKCFNCKIDLPTPRDMNLDHTMPLSYLYPLDETATCLCATCNGAKSDIFPIDFYTAEQIEELAWITGIEINLLQSKKANQKIVDLIAANIVWFFEDFLTFSEYVKERDGKRACDSILHSTQKIVDHSEQPFNLLEKYHEEINA
jgi:hypothetical protein